MNDAIIPQGRAIELITGRSDLTGLSGKPWDPDRLVTLIRASDRVLEVTGTVHELWILRGDIEFKVSIP